MAYEVVFSEAARDALVQTVEYLDLITGGPLAGRRLMAELDKCLSDISDNPELYGLSRISALADLGYRAAHVANYLILYYAEGSTVHVAWFFHQSQDYARYVI